MTDMTERLREQIDRLADYIMHNVEGEPSQSEGAVDCAIRIIDHLTAALAEANARAERERAAVVAWLKKEADEYRIEGSNVTIGFAISQAAREIERGEHLANKRAAALSDLAALDGESM